MHRSAINVISHIPHSSSTIPGDTREQFLLTKEDLSHELLLMTDHFTDELFCEVSPGVTDVVFPISRLVVDPERFEEDAEESMAKVGMGVIYSKTSHGRPLKYEISPTDRRQLIERYYRPHHQLLYEAVREALDSNGKCMVIDCHSFPSTALPYELDQSLARPEICIGTDAFHTPDQITELASRGFQDAGFTVAINQPFAGALVPNQFYQSDNRVLSLMIEVRRDLYMDESTGLKRKEFAQINLTLRKCIQTLLTSIDND
jgi:N-formylglutamate deformylase